MQMLSYGCGLILQISYRLLMKIDSYKDKGLRDAMVEHLRSIGISDEAVLKAMSIVPRQWFIAPGLESMAYEDRALPIGCEQTISQPSTVAYQTQLMMLKAGMKVLEIGTGSGYQAAVLCAMRAKVFTVERQKGLFDATKKLFSETPYRPHCFLGDGYKGLTEVNYGPYDRILITCGAPSIPANLVKQLKVGGIMVIPVGNGDTQEMLRVTKKEEDQFDVERFDSFKFVPMLSDVNF